MLDTTEMRYFDADFNFLPDPNPVGSICDRDVCLTTTCVMNDFDWAIYFCPDSDAVCQ